MIVYAVVWGVLALVLIALVVYRKMKTRDEDDSVHLSNAEWGVVTKQQTMAHSIEQLDRVGLILTIVTVVYGLALAGFYIYNIWQQGQKIVY
jgi:heme/copper-type cytochrome/quinol oxidase subunit 2